MKVVQIEGRCGEHLLKRKIQRDSAIAESLESALPLLFFQRPDPYALVLLALTFASLDAMAALAESSSTMSGYKALHCPLPNTERAMPTKLDISRDGSKLCYASGKVVCVRSTTNAGDCDVYTKHMGKVNVAKFSPNGEWVASVGRARRD